MRIIRTANNHIVESYTGRLLYCGEYFWDEPIVLTDDKTGLCKTCVRKYNQFKSQALKALTYMIQGYNLVFSRGNPYLSCRGQESIKITNSALEFLEELKFVDGTVRTWYQDDSPIDYVVTDEGKAWYESTLQSS